MILKRNFNPVKVFTYVKFEIIFSLLISLVVYLVYYSLEIKASLPFSISAILGSALAIFIAFRNNSAYSRWWEARTQWGGIINSSRILARLIITFADSHSHQENYDAEKSNRFKRELIYHLISWSHALRIHLRSQNNWDELKKFMDEAEFNQLMNSNNKVNIIQVMMGRKIYQAMAKGTLGGFDSFQMEGQLMALANYQGACERIKNTPLLRHYDYFTRLFLFAFIALLPFTLIGDFAKMEIEIMVVPISVFISFVFAIIGKVGEVNEDPFENRITDVPLDSLCNTIERDLKEMLNEENIPEKILPKGGYLN